ncbi:MAG: major facilitator superfamily transporter, partial [Frankiales bacterium]|nr:major facilitator superfamily transporter [Frankiales bacterium]
MTVHGEAGLRRSEQRGLVLAFLVFGVFWGAWAASLPAIRHQVGASDGQLGLALAAIALSAVPVMPVAGRIVDRYGADRALPASMLLFAVTIPLPALAHSLGALVLALVLVGVGTGALDLIANAATAAWERVERGKLMSVVHAAFSAGVLVGSVSAGLAREGGASPLLILSGVAVVTALVGVAQPPYRQAPAEEAAPKGRLPWFLVGVGLLTAGAFLCEDAIQSWSSLQLERGLDASPAISGLGPGLFAGSMAVGRLAGGAVANRIRDSVLLGAAAVTLAIGAVVVAVAGSPAIALVGLVVAGAGT